MGPACLLVHVFLTPLEEARDPPDHCSQKAEDAADDPMRRAMAAGVSAYVVAGLQSRRIAPVLRVAIARFEQEAALRQQLSDAQAALSSRKLVERAKGILQRTRGITEDEAHRLLRKLAMDRGLKLEQVAQQVLAAADLLAPPD